MCMSVVGCVHKCVCLLVCTKAWCENVYACTVKPQRNRRRNSFATLSFMAQGRSSGVYWTCYFKHLTKSDTWKLQTPNFSPFLVPSKFPFQTYVVCSWINNHLRIVFFFLNILFSAVVIMVDSFFSPDLRSFHNFFQCCCVLSCLCPAPAPRYLLQWAVTGSLATLLQGITIEYRKKGPDGQYGPWQFESRLPVTTTQRSISFQDPGTYQVRVLGQLPFGRTFEISPTTTVEFTQG